MVKRLSIYPIFSLANAADDHPFDLDQLPFPVFENVAIEDVSPLFNEETWKWIADHLGKRDNDELRLIKHALVHRYEDEHPYRVDNRKRNISVQTTNNLAALLRVIRPMRQKALMVQGYLQDGYLHVDSLQHPINLLDVPHVQRLFQIRLQDAILLRQLATPYFKAMEGDYWKFRMAMELHDGGHFQSAYWKARYSLWGSALEALYTSRHPNHSGSKVACERIKWFLGEKTPIYPVGDIPHFFLQSNLMVGDIVKHVYDVRNVIAHGDRIPDDLWKRTLRRGMHGELSVPEVCLEAISFIIRHSLIKILRDQLLQHFSTDATSEAYFGAQGLTNLDIKRRASQQQVP